MTSSRIARVSVAAAAVAFVALGASAQSRRAMTIDDAIDLVQLSAPRISPDGQRVLYTVSELAKWKENKRVTSIWMADVATGSARKFLGHEHDRSAAWSPDGRLIAFLASRDAKENDRDAPPQIWIIRTDGGEATRLTDHKGTIKAFEWLPDSSAIVFSAEPAKSEADKAAEKAGDDVIFVDEAANGQERGDFTGLWRVSVTDKVEKALTHDAALLIEAFQVSPDATKIALIYRRENARNGQFHAEVAVIEASTGTLTDITHNNAPEQNVQWSPDGRLLSYLAPSDASWELAEQKIWIVPATGGTPRRLLNGFAGSLRQYTWARDSQSITFGATSRGRGAAYRVAVPSGTVTRLAGGDWSGAMESISSDGSIGAAVVSAPATPAEIHVSRAGDGRDARPERLRDLHRKRSDTATRAVNEDALAGPHVAVVTEALQRGQCGDTDSAGLDERKPSGLQQQAALGAGRVLRPRACPHTEHLIARPERPDVLADGLYDAGDVHASDGGRPRLAE